jgi:23S rRNA A2030 N6-methylase RlmJ
MELLARKSDKDLVSEFHQGQQAYDLHQQAGYKTATFTERIMRKLLELQGASI